MTLELSETDRRQATKSARFYDRLASSYEDELTRWQGDLWTRSAFHHAVLRELAPPCRLLDFGCGPGIDAGFYAERGYRVHAYDNSPGMIAELRRRLAAQIGRGQVEAYTAPYEDFLAKILPSLPGFDGVVSNFAVVDQIADPRPLFEALAAKVEEGGRLVVSVLNPFFWREALHPSRWPDLLGARRSGRVVLGGRDVDTFCHTPDALRKAAAPWWSLAGIQSVGAFARHHAAPREADWSRPRTWAEKVDVYWGRRFPVRRLGRYFIVSFRRTA